HMDGARIGNALVRTNVSLAEATWKAGVDVLSFGATKGGAMGAEAAIFFDPKRGANMQDRRKRGGALAAGLAAAGCKPVWPVEANEVFAPLSAALDQKLKAAGASYYPWKSHSLP